MKLFVPTVTLALALFATAATAGRSGSGLRGEVLIEPGYPVCRVNEPCTRPAAHVVLVFSRHGRVAKRTETADDGSFRVTLRPGAYKVTAPGNSRLRELDPSRVVVPRRHYRRQIFKLDIGIQ